MTNQISLPERLRIIAEADERFGIPKENWAAGVRAFREAAAELDRLSRIEDKYNNLCPVLNEQAGEIERLRADLAKALTNHSADLSKPLYDVPSGWRGQ